MQVGGAWRGWSHQRKGAEPPEGGAEPPEGGAEPPEVQTDTEQSDPNKRGEEEEEECGPVL